MKQQPEYQLQVAICNYLKHQYPKVLFLSDTIASVKLNERQAARNKAIQKHNFKTPDLIILSPNSQYAGLFLELKVNSPYKKDGKTLKSDKHLEGQLESIKRLRELGYAADFAVGFEQTKQKIDNYLNLKQ